MIHALGEVNELRDELRAERQWNDGARRDIASLLDENLRLSQELTAARRELEEYKREALEARQRELASFVFDLVKQPLRGMVA